MNIKLERLAADCQHSGLFPAPGGGKIVAAGESLYVTYGNANNGSSLWRRSGDQWTRGADLPVYPPYLAVDAAGFLHAAGLNAKDRRQVWYFRSRRPHDPGEFVEPRPIHVQNYSALAIDPRDDSLYYFGAGLYARGIAFRRRTQDGRWSDRRVIVSGPIIYPGAVFREGVLHLMFCGWKDTAALYENVYYLRSLDRGETWRRSDGKAIPTPLEYDPIHAGEQQALERASLNFREGEARSNTHNLQMFVDRKGRPHVLHYFVPAYFPRPKRQARCMVAHARLDGDKWRHSLLSVDPDVAVWMASVAEGDDGTLHCICTYRGRNRKHFDLGYCRSQDAGDHWSEFQPVTSDADRLERSYLYPQWATQPWRGQLWFVCSQSGTPALVLLGSIPTSGRQA